MILEIDESCGDEECLSPASRLFHAPNLNCYIIAIMGCKIPIDPSVVIHGLNHTLINHPRFSSKLVIKRGKPRWIRTTVNVPDHVIIPGIDPDEQNPDQFVEDYISYLSTIQLDTTKPLWEIHLLNIKTSDAESVGVLKVHHSIGDGMSLMSLVLACTRQTSDPDALPTLPVQNRTEPQPQPGGWIRWPLWLLLAVWTVIRLVFNTFVDFSAAVATMWFLKDTKTPLKGLKSVDACPKRFVHRTVSLDDIKLVKTSLKMTVNDVLLGVTQAGLSRYLNRKYSMMKKDGNESQDSNNLPSKIRFRATILLNLRPVTGMQALADMMSKKSKAKWGNWIGFIILPFTIALQNHPLDYVRQAKAAIDRKKLSLEAIATFSCGKFLLELFGVKVAANVMERVLSNTTMSFSNMVGPKEEISFYGHPMAYLAPTVYGHPQALTIHYQSYMNKMTIALAVDPAVIPDPHQLCDDFDESLQIIKSAVLQKDPARLLL